MNLRNLLKFGLRPGTQSSAAEPVPVYKSKTPIYFALNDLDRKLREKISYRDGYFVELGANDGVNQSNTLHFERELGWRGVLIEPIPHRFLQCIENRAAENKIFCSACVDASYSQEFVKIIYSDLMSVAPGLDLDLGRLPEEHASVGQQFLGPKGRNFAFGAVARTLTSILDEAEAPQVIDLLSLDVEGAEFDVLNGIDYTKYKFQNMVIECRRFDRIEAFLKEKGYVFSEKLSHHDYHIVNSSSRSSS